MIIGGIQKTSLIDFPAKISGVIFTAGCNFKCPYCHNPELVSPPFTAIDPEEIFTFLSKRKSLLDGVVITGGEPTLHPDLPDFCDQIKAMGFLIKLDTNGSHPGIIQHLVNTRRVDYLAMDIKTLPENYSPLISDSVDPAAIYESIQVIKTSGITHEFRTTCVKPFVDDQIIRQISHIIEGADKFVLQKANIQNPVLRPAFFDRPDWQFSTEALKSFQKAAAPFIKEIQIR